MNEFQIIEHFFSRPTAQRKDVLLGIGDDAALLQVPAKQALVMSMDTLVAGVHFPLKTKPEDIGYKSLAVNLSDLAAMGAEPAWVTLALTMPKADKTWLEAFSKGFFVLMKRYGLQLVGGDTTHGPLSITVQVHGFVPAKQALRRDQAKPGDRVYVTGTLGDAGLALDRVAKLRFRSLPPLRGKDRKGGNLALRLNRPTPRIEAGLALRGISHCAIDISDGLAADLGHILHASEVGADIYLNNLPLSAPLRRLKKEDAWQLALNSGDDYELCFTAPPRHEAKLKRALKIPYTCIGVIKQKAGLQLHKSDGQICKIPLKGYRHF